MSSVPQVRVNITRVNATSGARAPRSVVVTVPGPQGPSGTANLGTVTVLNPDQNPSITAGGTARDRIYNFLLPRAAAVDVGTVSTLNPDQNPTVTSTVTDGDVDYDFGLPRAAEFTTAPVNVINPDQNPDVSIDDDAAGDYALTFDLPRGPTFGIGTVVTVSNEDPADVENVGADGDVVLDFDIPRGGDNIFIGDEPPTNTNILWADVTDEPVDAPIFLGQILDVDLTDPEPQVGDVLVYNGTNWKPDLAEAVFA